MNRRLIKTIGLVLMIVMLATSSLLAGAGCTSTEAGTIYISLLMPITGNYASGYTIMDTMGKAMIEYINTEDPIEGVTLALKKYDSKGSPAEATPGYEYLKGEGAKFLALVDTAVAVTLKNTLDADKFPAFMCSGTSAATATPGYVFCVPMVYKNQVQPLMQFIMDNWDYTGTGRNPKVGIFGWSDNVFGTDREDGLEEFISNNSSKFDSLESAMVPLTTTGTFATQVDALKDCDYVFLGAPANAAAPFMNTMRNDYPDPVFCIIGPDTGFMEYYVAMPGKAGFDGTLWASDAGFYKTGIDELSELARKLVDNYFSAEDKASMDAGDQPGLTTVMWSFIVPIEALREAVKGLEDPTDVTGEQIYNAATSLTFSYTGFPDADFKDGRRALLIQEKVYEYSGTGNTWAAVSDWITAPAYE